MSTDWLSMRASDADRERAADVLKAALAEGRLDWDEHRERLDAVMRSRTYGELQQQLTDLPIGPVPFPLSPSAPPTSPVLPGQHGPPSLPAGHPSLPGRSTSSGPDHDPARPDGGRRPVPLPGTSPPHPHPGLADPRIPPAPPAPLTNPWANYVPAPVRVTEPLAKVSVACAVLGLCTSGMSAVPAIVTGHLALSRIRRTNGEGAGLAVTGLVLGYLELVFVALWLIVAVLFNLGH